MRGVYGHRCLGTVFFGACLFLGFAGSAGAQADPRMFPPLQLQ